MAPPKPSTAASNTYAAPPSDSETSPTTSPEHSSKQEDSDPNYTLNYEEPETTCQPVTFLEHDERVCAPRARLGVRAIRWAIRQLRFEGATIAGLARQLATTWNTVWSHIKPCLQAASDDPARFAGVRVLGVDEHVWHHQDRRRRGPT